MEEKKFCKFCGAEIEKSSIVCPKCGRQLQVVKKAEEKNEKNNTQKDNQPKFYEQQWFMWVMLVFFAPVGIFLMWKFNTTLQKKTKIILTVVFAIFFLVVAVGGDSETTTTDNSSSNNNNNNNNTTEVSKRKVEVIDFSSMKEHEILTWCNDNNLNCNFKREYSNSVAKDGYIKQSVNAGEQVVENTKITVTYSLGKAPTKAQENAVKKAKSYLNYSAFSRKGLIEQLEFEGFTNEEAVYGVDNVGADWNEQAVKKAKSYLSYSSFSRKGLIEQLEFEGFTHEQAVYGVEQNGL